VKPRIEISSQFLARPLSRSGEADILSPQDRFDMIDLLNTVAWCIDAEDFGVLATIVTEDFIHDHPSGITNGRERFIEFLKSNPTYFDGCRTENLSPLLRSVDLSNSIVASHLVITRVCDGQGNLSASLPAVVAHGLCVDALRKEKEIWKLAKRTVGRISVAEAFMPDATSRALFWLGADERNRAFAG
jgi:hypothetical protein